MLIPYLVLNHKIELQREQLELGKGFSLGFCTGGQQFVVGEEDLSSAQLLPEISSGPDHGPHFQEEW